MIANLSRRGIIWGLTVFLVFFLTIATQGQQPLQVLHNHVRPAVANGEAKKIGPMSADEVMHFSIELPLRNQSELNDLLKKISDPASPDYRQFLTPEQFDERFGPTAADFQAVIEFAQANGFTVRSQPKSRLLLPVTASVAQVENAFHVTMNYYRNPTENRTFFSLDREPSVALSVPLRHIAGLNNFSIPRPALSQAPPRQGATNSGTGSGPSNNFLPSDMRAAYYGNGPLTGAGQIVGILEFNGFDMNNVNSIFTNNGQAVPSVPVNKICVDGNGGVCSAGVDNDGNLDPNGPPGWSSPDPTTGNETISDGEQVLDVAQIMGMAPGLSQIRVYIADGWEDATVLNYMANEESSPNLPRVISISWSWVPDDPTSDDTYFEKMQSQGQTVLVASGDSGAYPYPSINYPMEDEYITAAGGTDLTTTGPGGSWLSETNWSRSGGGWASWSPDTSTPFPIPYWQPCAANAANGCSTSLRNVPDVAMEANGDNYNCETTWTRPENGPIYATPGCGGGWWGTSFAAPRWAGYIALVNQQAAAAGTTFTYDPTGSGATIGFLNPTIYSIGEGSAYSDNFHNVTGGNNQCCGQTTSYTAVQGYNLVTGWGSPNGPALIDTLAGVTTATAAPTFSPAAGAYPSTQTVTISDATPGATIFYTTDGTTPTTNSTPYTAPIVLGTIESGGGTSTPGFSLAASAASVTALPGGSATDTITVTDTGGFTGAVTLTNSTLPSGVTASFGTNPTTGASVVTFAVSATAAPGTTAVTITGTGTGSSGTITATTTINLTVTNAFTLSASAPSVTVTQGQTVTDTITVTDAVGFNGAVTLPTPTLPSGVVAIFSPDPTTGTSVVTIIASETAATGTTAVTISGVSDSITATTTISLTVTPDPAPNFTRAATAASTSSSILAAIPAVASNVTIQAIAAAVGSSNSAVASATYTVEYPAATPTFSLSAGTYFYAQTLALADATPGATIYYTTNGTTPTTNSTVYTGPFLVPATETIKAIAIAPGSTVSSVASAAYTITFTCHVSYIINSQWLNGGGAPDGFDATISIDNTSAYPIDNWTLTWTFADGQTVGPYPWDGAFSQSGANVTVNNMSYNSLIPAEGSVSGIGFNGVWNGVANAVPTPFAVNGTPCK